MSILVRERERESARASERMLLRAEHLSDMAHVPRRQHRTAEHVTVLAALMQTHKLAHADAHVLELQCEHPLKNMAFGLELKHAMPQSN
jgi:hypothetical protein